MTESTIRALVVDDHPVCRMGLRELLAHHAPDIAIAAEVATPTEALAYVSQHAIDLAIIDVILPELSGPALAVALRRLQPDCKIFGLSMLDEPLRIAEMIRAGADGYACKTQPGAEIVDGLRRVLGGSRSLPPAVSSRQIDKLASDPDAWPLERLTAREREVFALLVCGHSNDSIAAELFIARRTVEAHRMHIMHKLAARSLVDLVRVAQRHGLPIE